MGLEDIYTELLTEQYRNDKEWEAVQKQLKQIKSSTAFLLGRVELLMGNKELHEETNTNLVVNRFYNRINEAYALLISDLKQNQSDIRRNVNDRSSAHFD